MRRWGKGATTASSVCQVRLDGKSGSIGSTGISVLSLERVSIPVSAIGREDRNTGSGGVPKSVQKGL